MLVIASHLPIGFLAAAVTLRAKVGEPVAVAFSWLTQLVSGVLYPLNLLPTWLAPLALLTPLTYSLEAARRLLLSGETISSQAVYGNIFNTLIYSAVAIPLSLIAFREAYRSALRRGELGQY
jgi:ABC-2 type transport system permease protein